MKLTTLASLSSVAVYATALGVNIGDDQKISVPEGKFYGENGVQDSAFGKDKPAGVEQAPANVAEIVPGPAKSIPEEDRKKIDGALETLTATEGVVIGNDNTISVPADKYYGKDGVQDSASAKTKSAGEAKAEEDKKDFPAAAQKLPSDGGVVIGDGQTISVPEGQYYGANGVQDSKTDGKKAEADSTGRPTEAAEPQDVALIARGAAGVNAKIDGSLELKHTDDGSAYLYVKSDGEARMFNLNDGVASVKVDGNVNVVGHMEAHGGVALLAAGKAEAGAIVKQKLEFNAQGKVTNVHFYASAEMTVGISVDGHIPAGAQPIDIYKKVSAEAKASVSFAAGGWTNGTHSTVTDYTTYCPEATTITITTCESQICHSTEIAVSSATTLTITGECVIDAQATGKASAHAPAPAPAPVSSVSTKAAQAAAATSMVSAFNGGAARSVAGAAGAGIAGIIALLI